MRYSIEHDNRAVDEDGGRRELIYIHGGVSTQSDLVRFIAAVSLLKTVLPSGEDDE